MTPGAFRRTVLHGLCGNHGGSIVSADPLSHDRNHDVGCGERSREPVANS